MAFDWIKNMGYNAPVFGSMAGVQYYSDPMYEGSDYNPSEWKIAPGFESEYPGGIPGETLFQYYSRLGEQDLKNDFFGLGGNPTAKPVPYTPPKPIEYLNADLAKAYGMDASTAYQEALSNTSYQRAVKDLQAAGLNPVLAASGAHAGGVYGAKTGDGVSIGASVSSGRDAAQFIKAGLKIVGALVGYKSGGIKGAVAGAGLADQLGDAMVDIADAM